MVSKQNKYKAYFSYVLLLHTPFKSSSLLLSGNKKMSVSYNAILVINLRFMVFLLGHYLFFCRDRHPPRGKKVGLRILLIPLAGSMT